MDYRERDRFRKRNIELIQTEIGMKEPSFCRELSAWASILWKLNFNEVSVWIHLKTVPLSHHSD
jgi:hypothetical protein